MANTERLNLRLSPSLDSTLAKLARQAGVSKADWLRMVVYCAKEEKVIADLVAGEARSRRMIAR